jgi:hypothetical protein
MSKIKKWGCNKLVFFVILAVKFATAVKLANGNKYHLSDNRLDKTILIFIFSFSFLKE